MRTITILTAIIVLFVIANGEEFILTHRGKVDSAAMNFEATHLSVEQCNYNNYEVGHQKVWNGTHKFTDDATVAVETREKTADTLDVPAREKTPAWVSKIEEKGKAHNAEIRERAKINEDRLSVYSQTEQNIAKNMGLSPWEIERNQLKKWGQEADSTTTTF
ncbi:MAG: hypothetical protein JW902_12655 [Syntrophaceae bacterium]|nr:hypothetical protein [Syntrophaceae bacterium]